MNLSNFSGKITIRPSSVDNFFVCGYQWACVFLGGENTIPGARAAIGTAIHKSAEVVWTDAMKTQKKDINDSKLADAAIEEFKGLHKDGLNYDDGEDINTANATILEGVKAFASDIVPFVDIPDFVEQRFTIKLDHPVVERLSGTVDYLSKDTLADVKTSKRKIATSGHITQQTIYKLLAEANGHKVDFATIQGVALTKNPQGHILQLEPNVPRTKFLINTMLDKLDAFHAGVDPKLLFTGNNKHYLCSVKYCGKYPTCPYVNGDKP